MSTQIDHAARSGGSSIGTLSGLSIRPAGNDADDSIGNSPRASTWLLIALTGAWAVWVVFLFIMMLSVRSS